MGTSETFELFLLYGFTLFSSGVDIPPVEFTAGQGIYSYPGLASADNPRLLTVPYCSFLNEST